MSAKIVYQRLDRRVSKSLQSSFNRTLSLEQEQVFRNYIQRFNEQNISTKVSMIYIVVNYILTKSHSNYFILLPQVSPIWTKQFLDRNLQFHKKKQKLLGVERKNAHNKSDFREYFKKYNVIHLYSEHPLIRN